VTAGPADGSTLADAGSEADSDSEEDVAAASSSRDEGGDPLAGTLALVLLPTLGALALGAKLRQSRA
jgi:hypothetical protein